MSENEKPFDAVVVRQLLKDEQAKRAVACVAAIKAVLAKHGCNLFAVPHITQDGRIVATIEIRDVTGDTNG